MCQTGFHTPRWPPSRPATRGAPPAITQRQQAAHRRLKLRQMRLTDPALSGTRTHAVTVALCTSKAAGRSTITSTRHLLVSAPSTPGGVPKIIESEDRAQQQQSGFRQAPRQTSHGLNTRHSGAASPSGPASSPIFTRPEPTTASDAMRRVIALLLAVGVVAGVTAAVAQQPAPQRAGAAAPALPAADAVLPTSPAALASALTATTHPAPRGRRTLERGRRGPRGRHVPRAAPPAHAAAHGQAPRARRRRARPLPQAVRGEARDTVRALRHLDDIPRD